MYNHILVPFDGSDVSRWVLRRASIFLAQPDVTVTLVQVVPAAPAQAADLAFRADRRHVPTEIALRVAANALRADARAELLFGDPATEILREIATGKYDLVVMATHARAGLERALLGSVAHRVLESSPVPLALFRPALTEDGALSPAAPTDPALFRRVLVPLDGSREAEEIVPFARDLAETTDARLFLFTAVEADDERAGRYLSSWRANLDDARIPVEIRTRVAAPVDGVLAAISESRLDAVAMTTHGRTGLARIVMGSVAEEILRRGRVPVLMLRNASLRRAMPAAVDPSHRVHV
jgi:nucleotide-binding universal stress UspA family protein